MSLSSIPSSDVKVNKNGHKYPAKRITLGVSKQVDEASYAGNIGVMELAKFHSTASSSDKAKFTELMKKKSAAKSDHEQKQMASQIWDHVQKVTNTKLHQMESTMQSFKAILETKDDFILQTLADRDINASIKDGKVVVHDHTQHAKAKSMVKRMGMSHEVVKAVKEDLDESVMMKSPDGKGKVHRAGSVMITTNHPSSPEGLLGNRYSVTFSPERNSPRGRTTHYDVSHHKTEEEAKAAKTAYAAKHAHHGVTTLKPLGEATEHKVGDPVHLGFGQRGGAGISGKLKKIEGDFAHVESQDEVKGLDGKPRKPVWKGHIKHVSKLNEDTRQTVQEAMPTHEFNKLVRGYLAHKKAAKVGNFKAMTIGQYARHSVKALATAPIHEEMELLNIGELNELSKSTLQSYMTRVAAEHSKEIKRPIEKRAKSFKGFVKAMDKSSMKTEAVDNPKDVVKMDVPLLIRLMEYAREDIKDDAALHVLATKLAELSKKGETLSMSDYEEITEKEEAMEESKSVVVPTLKPRNHTHAILAAKKNAGGAHKDKKREFKQGDGKHKARLYENTQSENE